LQRAIERRQHAVIRRLLEHLIPSEISSERSLDILLAPAASAQQFEFRKVTASMGRNDLGYRKPRALAL
jgi:hypothetical protein